MKMGKALSPARGEIWVENGGFRDFQSPVRDVMWVFYPSKYPHHVPTGLGKTSGRSFSTHITPLAGLPLRNQTIPGGSETRALLWIQCLILLISTILLSSCQPQSELQQLPYQPEYLEAAHPPSFSPMRIPADNPLTKAGVALGRKLFFDPILSKDSSIACSSCHQPELAFTDGKAFSTGVEGRMGKRSAMSLLNVGFYAKGLFWDGRVATLEEQSLHPVRDTLEMRHSWPVLLQKLQAHAEYPGLFRRAFGIKTRKEIDSILVGKALAQYERTLISADAKFDRVMREGAQFTPQEKRGWTIFFDASPAVPTSECNHCHVDPLFSTLNFENNGLVAALSLDDYPDKGRGAITGNRNDNGLFRVPTLRNLKYTAPYMHDGRFKTLDEVLDHYASGGHPGTNVSPNVRKLKLSKQDRADLIAFLNTLNDEN